MTHRFRTIKDRRTTSQRGYGADFQHQRRQWEADLRSIGTSTCCIGGEPIHAWQLDLPRAHPLKLHLDHTPDRTAIRGWACARHNRQDGARRGRARQKQHQRTTLYW